MPSFSLARSMIGRFLADCEISMSDFGDLCCEAGIWVSVRCKEKAGDLDYRGGKSGKACAGRELGGGCEFGGVDLLAVGRLHARHLEASVGADHREAVGLDRDDLAHLAGDALGILGGQRLGVEDLQGLPAGRGAAAGPRSGAAVLRLGLPPTPSPT